MLSNFSFEMINKINKIFFWRRENYIYLLFFKIYIYYFFW